ncbi:bifunctional [glutamine synthetase] adenylyltransferase/[glutamine synthetase]-adenylyl-L-tyrosine phosphorylase [Nitratireductor sp. XY-223]|uniref:bifunctional [glutamine synthetase] adenylyltransferase/[glutamine synthetase]-adenylyl-L-tyrosine phosphorylase n=1 Tax=Nitratireductor sp. XY-223 TaxID=2561926 RepID=UPI0010A9A1F5|nr:bifunctional [glutamine synthetase] adenylyltransferase/[glutamine synthetase]-adenylyl-L-tyrosine phosphorylase [Nitratireductor sp. XY-223]
MKAVSPEASQEFLIDLRNLAADQADLEEFLDTQSPQRELLLGAAALSPYLRDIALAHPECILPTFVTKPEVLLDGLVESAMNAWRENSAEADLMRRLRDLKRRLAFSLALYDLGRMLETRTITAWLSAFARASVSATVNHLLHTAHDAGKLVLKDADNPSRGSGLAVIGMGKLGSSELNYSSDIDLVVIYDPQAAIVNDRNEATDVFSRLVRRLIHILQERTGDGYVFRTDLRLRPDPGSTPLALPYEAALHYYEGRGQNWERAAYIKADVAAGDLQTGSAFCRDLTPFIFRKYLDYVAIADIHSIKRQIHAHKGFGEISVYGHNVKLGRGGIREIEFFVQTQQLIAGGRMPALRTRPTEATLAALAEAGWIDRETEASLRDAYWFLRDVEHRIQMRRDEQSHVLPDNDEELEPIALMMGFDDTDGFAAQLRATLKLVEKHYARLFEHEKGLTAGNGNLVFTGDDDDPGTIETLSRMGFQRPSDMSRVIRTWHYGRYRATQTAAARKRLTDLMPELLQIFADTGRPDETLLKFDAFLSGLPAGIQLFSLLGTNSGLMSLLVSILGSAPKLASVISRKPHVFDGMLDPTLLAELPTREVLSERLEAFLDGDFVYEEVLDRLRIFAAEQKFLIGVRLLTGAINGERAGRAFSHLADLTLKAAIAAVRTEMEAAHGRVDGGTLAVVGLGKLGSLEMTAESDIDMILLYSHDPECMESDGKKPIDPVRYYTRFTQRLVAALSAPTAEGVLYEVDLRLRPSGNKGPVATHIRAFRKYQREEAWTWEHMALTRARIVAGDPDIAADAEAVFADVLSRSRDIEKTAADIEEMRKRIEDEKPAKNIWDLKLIPGGLIDIEFIAQFLRLHAARLERDGPSPGTRTKSLLENLAPSMIGEDSAATLMDALKLYTQISQVIRLCLEERFDPESAPLAFRELMLRGVDFPDIGMLEAHLKETSGDVRAIFEKTICHRQLL